MKQNAPTLPGLPSHPAVEADIATKTEALFQDIADTSGNELLRQTIGMINTHLQIIRPYEGSFIPDRHAEYEALSRAWVDRDMPLLRDLTAAYFRRRRELIPQIAKIINHPN